MHARFGGNLQTEFFERRIRLLLDELADHLGMGLQHTLCTARMGQGVGPSRLAKDAQPFFDCRKTDGKHGGELRLG
jgi:hypothetical protein